MNNKTLKIAIVAISAIFTSNIALAEEKPRHGFYVGADVSYAKIKGFCSYLRIGAISISCNDYGIGFGGVGGFAFNDYLGLEAGVKYASGFDYDATYVRVLSPNGETTETGKAKVYSLSFGGTGRLPITNWLAITGKAGINSQQFLWTTKTPFAFRREDFSVKPYYGIGIEMSPFAKSRFSGLIEWSRYNGTAFRTNNNVAMNYFSAQIVYKV
ncbi:MAG: outer membrane beta-barrel protein [Gammaproteobacteria bacterium WSBS_2016_MAG_OTU1]